MEVQITPAQIDMDILDVDEQRITAEKLNNSPTTLTVNKTRSKLFLDQVLMHACSRPEHLLGFAIGGLTGSNERKRKAAQRLQAAFRGWVTRATYAVMAREAAAAAAAAAAVADESSKVAAAAKARTLRAITTFTVLIGGVSILMQLQLA